MNNLNTGSTDHESGTASPAEVEALTSRATEGHLAAIVESSDDAIVSKTLDGIIRSWNRGAERIFGYTAAEVIGKPITILLPEDRLHEEIHILNRIRNGDRVDHFETIRIHKDGTQLQVSVTISPVRDGSGTIVGASKVARDITHQKVLEQKLSDLNDELERRVRERTAELEAAQREMEGFTYSVSHDLRAPLRSIISASMILKEDFGDALPAEAAEYLDRQAAAAKRMAALIDDLLKLSRIGRQGMKPANIDFTALTTEAALELQAREGGCHVDFDIQPGMRTHGDPQLLKLVLLNLLDNACKFSPSGGPVQIGHAATERGSAFFVRDTGVGFSMEYEDKLFVPFERLVHEDQFPGTGIGLANVKRIIDRHNGKIWAQSEPGKGATFYFTLG